MADADISADQRDVVAFLSDTGSYASPVERVSRIDTHGAHVFLAGSDVFKIKRAVRYPYMDFSTLALRRAACMREFEINAASAPSLYKGVVAITREADGRLALGGAGEPVEWAVHMARFREEDVLANRVRRQALSVEEAKALGDAVAASHARAIVVRDPSARTAIGPTAGDVVAALRVLFEGNADAVTLAGSLPARVAALSEMLESRSRDGFVRRCHGDLHLSNIVLCDGRPTLFDALEFDEGLATTDVLYDLAFLLMDLEHRGQRATANAVFNRYLWRRQEMADLAGLAALPVFLSLRAAIRAMVGAQRCRLTGEDPAAASAYLRRATGYLSDDGAPRLVLVGGLSGSGKSTLAAGLAPSVGRAPGALHLRSDLERKALFGAGEYDRLDAAAYTAEVTARVYETILLKCEAALHAGHSVIADAVHAHREERAAIESVARRLGARLHAFWLEAPRAVLMTRVAARKNDASDATPQVVEQQMTYDLGHLEWTRLDASGTAEETLRTAMSHLHASIDPG